MAYPYDGMFYPTLPEDAQDFPAVLRGIQRTLADRARLTAQSIIESGQRADQLQREAFPDPTRPTQLQNPEALAKLTDMIMGGPMGFASAGTIGPRITKLGDVQYDPRFDPRVIEQPRIQETTTKVEQTANLDAPTIPLTQFEGFPFITSMSDRTAAGGLLTSIDDVMLKRPVELQGGQDFMFTNPNKVWASASSPVRQIMNNAQFLREITGKDPLFIPWRMAPSGGDFAKFTGETMLSYAESALPKNVKKEIDKEIKKIAESWKGIDSPESISQYQSFSDSTRKKIKQTLDVNFREAGGLGIGQARLAVTDPKQFGGSDAQIMNIGRIFADQPIIQASGHASYPKAVPGEGLGRVDRDLNIFQLLPKVVEQRGMPSAIAPRQTDIRALQMKPYAGILDEQTLRLLGY